MTRAAPRHPATKAQADLQAWVQRWPAGAPIPAVTIVNAWLAKVIATPTPAKAKPEKAAKAPKPAAEPKPRRMSRAEKINADLAGSVGIPKPANQRGTPPAPSASPIPSRSPTPWRPTRSPSATPATSALRPSLRRRVLRRV